MFPDHSSLFFHYLPPPWYFFYQPLNHLFLFHFPHDPSSALSSAMDAFHFWLTCTGIWQGTTIYYYMKIWFDFLPILGLPAHTNILLTVQNEDFLVIMNINRTNGLYKPPFSSFPGHGSSCLRDLSVPLSWIFLCSLFTKLMLTHPSDFSSNILFVILEKMTILIFQYLFQVSTSSSLLLFIYFFSKSVSIA